MPSLGASFSFSFSEPTALAASFVFFESASLTITFVDTSAPGPSGPITGWAWDFGDSNTSTAENPVHVYAAPGTYTVTLTVTGTGGDGTSTVAHDVPVTVVPPVTFPLGNSWMWVVTGLDGITKTFLNRLATNVSMTYVLDDSYEMQCDLPSDNPEIYRLASDGEPFVSYGRRLIYGLRREEPPGEQPWVCRFSGVITILQDQAHSDEPVTHLTAHDPWTWAKTLPVLTPDGNLLPANGYTYVGKTGDFIAKDVIANAYAWMEATPGFKTGGHWKWTSSVAPDALFIDIADGTFETTEVIPKFPIQQSSSVADVWTQLCQTGDLDIVLHPIYDPRGRPGVLSVMNVYNQAGSDRPNATFGWDMWPHNLVGIDDLRDGTQIENWAQFFAGGIAAPHHSSSGSIASYGPYWVQKNIGGPADKAEVELLAIAEVALRKKGKQTLQIDPTPELSPDPFTAWFLGDTVYAWGGRLLPPSSPPGGFGNALRAGVRSPQVAPPSPHRVYGFQIDLADDQVETITNLLLTDPNAAI